MRTASFTQSFSFNIPKPAEKTPLLKRGFEQNGLSLFIQKLQKALNKHFEDHAISKTASYQSFIQLCIEFVKNAIDAKATRITIHARYDEANNKSSIIVEDNGHGFEDKSKLGSCVVLEELFQSSKKSLLQDKKNSSPKTVYGGAGLGNIMAAHFNEKYGHAIPGEGLVRCNKKTGGAILVLSSTNAPTEKTIETADGEYLNEIYTDAKDTLARRYNVDTALLRLDTFQDFVSAYKKNPDPHKSLEKEFCDFAAKEITSRKIEQQKAEEAEALLKKLSSSSLFATKAAGSPLVSDTSTSSGVQTPTSTKRRPSNLTSLTLSPR